MRTIEEIKRDMNLAEGCMNNRHSCDNDCINCLYLNYNKNINRLREENYQFYNSEERKEKAVKDISADRLEEICNAERDGRGVVLPCGVDLMKIYNELTSVCEGDAVENYTNGYRWGHKNGQIELIRRILNISEGVSHKPEQALLKGEVQWSKQGKCPATPEQFEAIYNDDTGEKGGASV